MPFVAENFETGVGNFKSSIFKGPHNSKVIRIEFEKETI